MLPVLLPLALAMNSCAMGERDARPSLPGGADSPLIELLPLAEQGDAQSQYAVGKLFHDGWEVYQDYDEARKWYLLAAEQGVPAAYAGLGWLHAFGRGGVSQDYVEARRWYLLAAEQGDASAQVRLGVMNEESMGGPRDIGEAVKWYRLAVDQGNHEAQYRLGLLYKKGLGVSRDHEEAVRLFKLVAEQEPRLLSNEVHGMVQVGLAYWNGEGVPQDLVLAYMWLLRAADRTDSDWVHELPFDVRKQMTSDQAKTADKRVHDCLAPQKEYGRSEITLECIES